MNRLEAVRAWFTAMVSSLLAKVHSSKLSNWAEGTLASRPGISGVIAVFVVVLVAGILLMVGALVEAFVYNQLPTSGLASGQIASITTINSDVVSALALLGVGLIALGAGGVISALLGAFNFGGKQ